MKISCLALLGSAALSLSGCANQTQLASDIPGEGPVATRPNDQPTYEEPAAWLPTK